MKKFWSVVLLLISFITTISASISYFKFQDINTENYIQIGSIQKKFEDISLFAYVASGPALTLGGEIIHPYKWSYEWAKKLSDYPYDTWAKYRRFEILTAIQNNNGIIPESYIDFAKQKDNNYLYYNPIHFDGNLISTFSNNKALHLFVAIYNNAHLIDNPKKINIKNEKNLYVESNITFQGMSSGATWNLDYKNNIDIFNKRYYVTSAYTYNKNTKTFFKPNRGNWYFYNAADLIIIDLGTTGHIEEVRENWVWVENKKRILHNLVSELKKTNDTEAKLIKANYNITFAPSWDSSKVLKQFISLDYLN